MDGECGDHLRLAPGLDAEVVGNAGVDDLLHDLAELVHLDREDAAVVVLVTAFRNGAGKGFVETAHTVAQEVVATDQQRKTETALLGLVDQFHQVDLLTLAAPWADRGVSGGIDPYITLRPSLHVVESGVLMGDGSGGGLGHLGIWKGLELTNITPFGDMLMSFFCTCVCGWRNPLSFGLNMRSQALP